MGNAAKFLVSYRTGTARPFALRSSLDSKPFTAVSCAERKRNNPLHRLRKISGRHLMRSNVIGFTLSAMLFAFCFSAEAQQPKKIPRIGYVSTTGNPNNPGPNIETFRRGLQDLGYTEGKNILIETRYIEGKMDQTPGLVAELLQLKVDVLVVNGLTPVRVAKQATKTIPIVMVTTQDPVATGLIDSLARPGGDAHGLHFVLR